VHSLVTVWLEWNDGESIGSQSLDLPCVPVVGDVISDSLLHGRTLRVVERQISRQTILLKCVWSWERHEEDDNDTELP
jgi:hypothetical protein